MDSSILDNTKHSPAFRALRDSFIQGDPGALLCVEFYADRAEDLSPRLRRLEEDLRGRGMGTYFHHAYEAAAQQKIWHLREASLGLSMNQRGDAKSISFVEDTAVAPEVLRDYIERFQKILTRHRTTAGVYAHASVGCLHVRPVINMKTADGLLKFDSIANEVADLVLEFGGALSGEHGDGLLRSPFIEKMFGSRLYGAFREIKQAFDPDGLLNPGKIIDPPPLTANLRYGAGYENPNPFTFFDYSDFGGLGGAVDMCSGVGACRKKLEGTMCPSYMATLDERDTTRARANVLRLAMNGRLGESGLGDEGVKETLELCLECRACKAECPVSVDVARFKSEFLADYYRRHGAPVAARLLGHAHTIARLGSLAPSLANRAQEFGRRLAGIDSRRSLPQLAAKPLSKQMDVGDRGLLLFNDTFINYYDPEIGLAVDRVMKAAGQPLRLAPNACCGRPLISKGLLGAARRAAEENVRRLAPLAHGGVRLIFCEPSCLSAVKEDAPSLLRGAMRDLAQRVADASVLFEDYLEQELRAGRASLALKESPHQVMLHGHCHQRAMGLLPAAKALLNRVPGVRLVDPEASCCGMAGSFGYTHYDVSRQMAERRLLPAARSAQFALASGTSCRHQMLDLAEVKAMHPAQFLEQLL
jgi:Fe-S oxidoreductase